MTLRLAVLFIILFVISTALSDERFTYISTERPVTLYVNEKYMNYFNMTSRRYGRRDPFYYVNVNFDSKVYVGNNFSIHFYFYEFFTNRYERGFVELHFKFCDLIHKDELFGKALRQGRLAGPCPFPPGVYNLSNMTMSAKHIPRNFPFKKGRIYSNLTIPSTKETVGSAYINMEIKEWRFKKNN